jgi:hypothetical protein
MVFLIYGMFLAQATSVFCNAANVFQGRLYVIIHVVVSYMETSEPKAKYNLSDRGEGRYRFLVL